MANRDFGRRYRDAGKRRAGGLPFHRRHRKLVVGVLSFVLLVVGAGASYAYLLNSKFGNIAKVKTSGLKNRPDPDKGKALNIMLLGSDKGKAVPGVPADTTLAEDAKAAKWPSGKYRSDTLMVVHISENRKHVYLVSIPRDTLHDDLRRHRLSARASRRSTPPSPSTARTARSRPSSTSPTSACATWRSSTGPASRTSPAPWAACPSTSRRPFYDPSQKIQWQAGQQTLEGKKALDYVRTRYGLQRGDFDRIARQQNFLRAMMKKMLAKGTMRNPVKLTRTLSALTENLTVDEEWNSGDMRALALSLRGTEAKDVTFLTAPVAGTETVPGLGSVVRLDELKSKELFTAMKRDTMQRYIKKYPDDVLEVRQGDQLTR